MMKMKNLKIGTQMKTGLGLVLLLALLLTVTAYLQTDSLWQQTRGLYEHPLQVRQALGELKAALLDIQGETLALFLTTGPEEEDRIVERIARLEAQTDIQFNILYERFLGPRPDLDQARQALAAWNASRAATHRLRQDGRTAEVLERIRHGGTNDILFDQLMKKIETVSDFQMRRADRFFQEAGTHRDRLSLFLVIMGGVILLLTSGIIFLLMQNIRVPLEELTEVARSFQRGNLDARSRYESANEFGTLAASFNDLAGSVQTELESREKLGRIAAAMLREEELLPFSQLLLKSLLADTGSAAGAIYLRNEDGSGFEHFVSIGLDASVRRPAFSAADYEGEFGATLLTRQIQHIKEISADTTFLFPAVTGSFRPREIITIPVLDGPGPAAIISLASLREYSAAAIRLVNDLQDVLTARLNGVLVFRQLQQSAARLKQQNRELETQQRELAAQADELGEQNIELEMQKKQLDEANRLKNVFLSNMSHELRTPLNSVIALAGVLGRRTRGQLPAEEYGYLEIIERNGKHLLALINDILDLSRIEAGREEIGRSEFNIRELVDTVTSALEVQAQEKNIALRNRTGGGLPPLCSDFAKCRHILENIAANAVKFTNAGHVEITAEAVDGWLRIAVADTGIGIGAGQLPHIFDEFRQADESTARRFGGTGLGLAIAKRYATMLGGRITVTSIPGEGSTFTIHLPLSPPGDCPAPAEGAAKTERPAAPGPLPAPPARPGSPAPAILVVEDSEPAVIQLTDILTTEGYRVQVARTGKEALARAAAGPADAMILDLMMPEMDGFEVLRAIRAERKTARLPVLILTAKHISREELSFLEGNHIQQLIRKGEIDKAGLLAAVARLVAPPSPSPGGPGQRPARRPPAGRPVILVVEDNPDNLQTVRALLADAGTIEEAGGGAAGLARARATKPDLILLDISLPGLDGFRVLDQIRAEETLRHIPVIALTARAMKGDREDILTYGFDGYVSKPLDAAELNQTIREILYG